MFDQSHHVELLDDERPGDAEAAKLDELISHFSLHDPEVQRHRVALYHRMQQTCPVSQSDQFGGCFAVSTYKGLYEAAHAPERFSSFPVTIPPFGNPVPMVPIEVDPPLHAKYRSLVHGKFSPKAVAAMEEPIRAIVVELLDGLAGRREVDLAEELAVPLPMRVLFSLLLGVPSKDWEELFRLSMILLQPDPTLSEEAKIQARGGAGMEMAGYFAGLLASLREHGYGDDLISDLDQAEVDGQQLTDEQIFGFCLLLVNAGFDTTASAISRMFNLFGLRPEIREAIRERVDDPVALEVAVDEVIRYISPVAGLARTVTEDCVLEGTPLAEGARIHLLWPAANRDPEEFPDPDEFVVDRRPNRHVGFGSGIHRCLGLHIARGEVKILLEEFLRRMPDYRLSETAPPVWHTGETWGVKSLPVVFDV
ncbi:MAG TPA: cytochrome P450 [Solirubrobacteraceae bacterium]|jgi:cytochrome P450|nr:cytochrome P450 [Solirubrobacteraceae bacterium]